MPKSRAPARGRPLALKRSPPKRATARKPAAADGMRIMVRDLMLSAKIGLHQHERIAQQRIRVNLDLAIADLGVIGDDYDKVVCYGELVTGVRHVVGAGHVNLVERLAERIGRTGLGDPGGARGCQLPGGPECAERPGSGREAGCLPRGQRRGRRDRAPPARRGRPESQLRYFPDSASKWLKKRQSPGSKD